MNKCRYGKSTPTVSSIFYLAIRTDLTLFYKRFLHTPHGVKLHHTEYESHNNRALRQEGPTFRKQTLTGKSPNISFSEGKN